ncbi:hypothetical protein ACFUNF_42210 [Streptomyces sp. NPDC057291]|uniref:hypothetical protein n=1 Tax=Streptomyces sp. NPDC057291 TaxID=3346087 RepID=UPI00362FC652
MEGMSPAQWLATKELVKDDGEMVFEDGISPAELDGWLNQASTELLDAICCRAHGPQHSEAACTHGSTTPRWSVP